MATRDEAMNFIKSNFNCKIDGNVITLSFIFEGGRTQMVHAGCYEEVLQVASPFAKADSITANAALELNESIFGLTRIDDFYYLVNTLFLEDIDASEINKGFEHVAYWADILEKKISGNDTY